MNNQTLPARIKLARENMGITKAEASRRLNLSKIGYCRYEYGERTPSSQTLEIIAMCFNTSSDFLQGLTDDPKPNQIVVSKKTNPIIFELVTSLQNDTDDSVKRLLAYYNSLKR